MGTVDLAKDLSRIDEQDLVSPIHALLAAIEKPQRHRQGHRVKEVGPNGHDYIDASILDQLPPDFELRAAGIGSRVGHDEASSSVAVERRVEDLDPDVVPVIGTRHAEREALVSFEP